MRIRMFCALIYVFGKSQYKKKTVGRKIAKASELKSTIRILCYDPVADRYNDHSPCARIGMLKHIFLGVNPSPAPGTRPARDLSWRHKPPRPTHQPPRLARETSLTRSCSPHAASVTRHGCTSTTPHPQGTQEEVMSGQGEVHAKVAWLARARERRLFERRFD
jgi:hypothetical protein